MSNPNPWGAGRGPEQPSSISARGIILVIVAIAVVAFIAFYVFSR